MFLKMQKSPSSKSKIKISRVVPECTLETLINKNIVNIVFFSSDYTVYRDDVQVT